MTKDEFRKQCLKRLRADLQRRRTGLNRTLYRALAGASHLLLFWPLPGEPDIRPLLHRLRREGRQVYLPFMEGESFRMVPFRYPLTRKRFGIFEPGFSTLKIRKIDIAVVPAVGVDARGRRIGFGKGMYDRFFAASDVKPEILFVQSLPCVTDRLLGDDHDISAALLLTPAACFSFRGNDYDHRNTIGQRRCRRQRFRRICDRTQTRRRPF